MGYPPLEPAVSMAEVLENCEIGPGCFRMRLADANVARSARPGQFVHVRLPGSSLDPLLRRPFSVCLADPGEGTLLVLYQVVGRGTQMLAKIRPGDYLNVLGPLGRGFDMPPADGKGDVALVAGGLGIAPLIMLSRDLSRAGVGCSFLVGGRSQDLLVGLDLVPCAGAGLAAPRRRDLQVVTEDGSIGRQGLVTDALDDLLRDGGARCVYACGPVGMLREVGRLGEAHRVPVQVSLEERMACGLGACLGCAVKARPGRGGRETYLRVCVDGPVFWAGEVDLDGIA